MFKAYIKKTIKQTIGRFGPHNWPMAKGKLIVLAYHRVLPKDDPRYALEQPPMVVTPETLRNNLQWAKEKFELVKLGDWVKGNVENQAEKKCCAITFDDGWIDNFEHALPILKELKIPATIFCVSNMIDRQTDFWPGRLTNLLMNVDTSTLENRDEFNWIRIAALKQQQDWNVRDADLYNRTIELCKVYSDREIHEFIDITKNKLNLTHIDSRQIMTSEELRTLIDTGLIEIGSHTKNHTRLLADTPDDILIDEIVGSKKQLESMLNVPITTFCYPNGYAPDNAVALVNETYDCGTALYRGWNDSNTMHSAKMARVGLHENIVSEQFAFKACLSGLIGY